MLITSPAYAGEALTVLQDIGSKWQSAWNSGDAGKLANLYVQDAVFSSASLVPCKASPISKERLPTK